MKHFKLFLVLALIFIANNISAQTNFDKWPALKVFKEVMSETFHAVEKNNFTPAKTRSEEIMQKATLLLKTDVPSEFKTSAILTYAERLQIKSKALDKLVKSNGTNEEIAKSITDLNTTFHIIVGLCFEDKK